MGGLVGSGFITFSVVAGLLHCPIAVNLHRADAVLDPLLPTSMISNAFAQRLHLAEQGSAAITAYGATATLRTTGPVSIDIHPASFRLPRLAIEDAEIERRAPAKANIVLGADALASAMLRLDLRTHRLSSISASDARRATKGATPVAVRIDQAGHLLLAVRIGDAAPVPAILDLGSDAPVTIGRMAAKAGGLDAADARPTILVGGLSFGPQPIRVSDQGDDGMVVGAPLFDGRIVILDLADRKIWVSR